MSNVTVSETNYNITVSDTTDTVSVSSGTTINVAVNSTTLSTALSNTGTGAAVGRDITGDTLRLRKIKSDDAQLTVTEGTDDIALELANTYVHSLTHGGSAATGVDPITSVSNGVITDKRIFGTTDIVVTENPANTIRIAMDTAISPNFLTVQSGVSGDLIPTNDDANDLGSSSKRWRDLYLGPGSLYINNQKVLEDDSGTIKISTDSGQNMNIQSGGTLTINNTGDTTTIIDNAINLGQTGTNTSVTTVNGRLEAPDLHVGDLEIEPLLINSTSTNGNLEIRTDGTGYTHINTADLYVGPLSGAVKIDENSIGVTAGTLTVTGNLVGNVTGQVSDLSNKSTSDLSEGTNKYYTDERVDDRVNALLTAGSNITITYDDTAGTLTIAATDTEDDLSNNDTDDLSEGSTNLYYTDARFDARLSAKSTSDLSEGTNKYYTDERVDDRVNALLTAGSNISLTYDDASNTLTISSTDTEDDLSNNDTDDLAEGSSNLYHTTARAISAVEGESTLDLSGAVTITGQLTANDTIKVDDGFVQTSFNPYGAGNNMPTTVMGVGQLDGWAAMHIRSRGEHDFGIGSPYNLAPRGLLTLSAGRRSGSNDAELSNNDSFGALLWNPYASYRTGTEWLTPSASIYGIATQDHSESNGFGTKLEFSTTENNSKAGAADLAHTNKSIVFQGTTITTTDTLKIDDDLQVTGNIGNNGSAVDFDDNIIVTGNVSSKTTTIGDFDSSGSPAYSMSGIQIDAGDVSWPTVVFKEYAGTDGGGNKPVNLFTNPGFETEVFGGTPSAPAALGASKRLLSINGNAANGATLPGTANLRILGQTVNTQSGSNRGSEFIVQTTPVNTTSTIESIKVIANKLIIGQSDFDSGHAIIQANGGDLKLDDRLDTNGNNILNSSGDVTIDDNLKVNTNLTVDGNTTLGNNTSADTVTVNAKLTANGGLVLTSMDTATANYLAGLGAIDEGGIAYITDGDGGSKCIAVYDGSNWKRISLGANISSS